jgi:hypothetical protein
MSSSTINSAVSKAAAIIIVAQLLSVGPVTITCQVINLLFSRLDNCQNKNKENQSFNKKSDYTRKKTTPIEPICKLPSAE